jgi:hypothetical protein
LLFLSGRFVSYFTAIVDILPVGGYEGGGETAKGFALRRLSVFHWTTKERVEVGLYWRQWSRVARSLGATSMRLASGWLGEGVLGSEMDEAVGGTSVAFGDQ